MLSRTFAYRRLYVDAVAERAPNRALLAVWSEVLRLGFVLIACVLFGLVFWLLTAGAFARDGAVAVWTLAAGVCTLGFIAGAVAALTGIATALRDIDRVRRVVAGREPH